MKKWKTIKLGNAITIKHGYAFKGEYFSDLPTDWTLVTPGNFAIGGGFQDKKIKYYDGPIDDAYVLDHDDLIVTMTDLSKQADTLGFSAKVPKGNSYLHNQRIGLVKVKSNGVDKDFLYWAMRNPSYQRFIGQSSTGSTVKHTSPKKIYAATIRIPCERHDQQKIASILSAYDDLIEKNLRRIKLLEELAQQTYEEWFVRMRFPGYETAVWDEGTGLPVGWGRVRLKEIAKINPQKISTDFSGPISYIDISAVGVGIIEGIEDYSSISEAPGRARRLVGKGDLIYSTVRPNRRSYAIIGQSKQTQVASTGFCVVRAKYNLEAFVKQSILHEAFVNYLISRAKGAAYPAVVAKDFSQAEILLPDTSVLLQYSLAFNPGVELILALVAQNKLLREARDLLLPRLMSGEVDIDSIRVPNLDEATLSITKNTA